MDDDLDFPASEVFKPRHPPLETYWWSIVIACAFFILCIAVYLCCKLKYCKNNNPGDNELEPMELELQVIETSPAPVRVPPAVRLSIPHVVYCEDFKIPHHEEICALCQCEFKRGKEISIIPRCTHVLHTDCIDEYMDRSGTTYPYCREPLAGHGEDDVGTSTAAADGDNNGEDTAGANPL